MRSSEVEYVNNEYFQLTIEPYYPVVSVHIKIHKFNKKGYKLLKIYAEKLFYEMKDCGFEDAIGITQDADKLALKLGAEFVKEVEIENKIYRMFKWPLQSQ